eukprot:SAG11_NODE_716_length_7614_cov_63.924837_10_plen_42_part_00
MSTTCDEQIALNYSKVRRQLLTPPSPAIPPPLTTLIANTVE